MGARWNSITMTITSIISQYCNLLPREKHEKEKGTLARRPVTYLAS